MSRIIPPLHTDILGQTPTLEQSPPAPELACGTQDRQRAQIDLQSARSHKFGLDAEACKESQKTPGNPSGIDKDTHALPAAQFENKSTCFKEMGAPSTSGPLDYKASTSLAAPRAELVLKHEAAADGRVVWSDGIVQPLVQEVGTDNCAGEYIPGAERIGGSDDVTPFLNTMGLTSLYPRETGIGDRVSYLAMTTGLADPSYRNIKTGLAPRMLAIAPRNRAECRHHCGDDGFCDPSNADGCGGIFCGRRSHCL